MLSLFAKQEAQRLLRETGHSLTIDDFDDINKLDELCRAITESDVCNADILDMPVCVGGVELRQPSIGVLEWYNDYFLPMFSDNGLIADGGLAYALSLSDTPEELWLLKNKRDCRKHVKRFLRRLKCTHQELQDAITSVLGLNCEEGGDDGESSSGRLIAMLCREYGHSPKYWLWEAPLGLINTFTHDYVARVEAEIEQARKASSGAQKPAPAPSRIKKFDELRKHVNELRDKWQKM